VPVPVRPGHGHFLSYYPIAGGAGNYDSGQLGDGTPAVGRLDWRTPTNLAPGTYTYFCRIHPFMRGLFRIIR
jgi:hypothetical protein